MAKPHPAARTAPRQELFLDKPRLQLPRANLFFECSFYTLLVLLGGFGALCCLATAFKLPLDAAPLLAVGTVYAILGVLQVTLPRGRAVVFAVGALAWGIALLYLAGPAAEGAGRVLNQMLQGYSEKLRVTLGQFAVPEAGTEDVTYTCTCFAAMLLPPYFWALSWILARRRNGMSAFSFTGAVLTLALALSIIPDFWAICMLLLFWCMLLLSSTVLGRRHRVVDEQRRFIVCGTAVRPALLALLPAAALCMLLVYILFPRDTYVRPHLVNDIRSGFINGFGLEAIMQGGQGSNNNRISLEELRERTYSGKTAMRVRFNWEDNGAELEEHQQKEYLKSFVGSVYTGRSWEKLPPEDVQALESFMAPGRVQNMNASFVNLFPVPEFDTGRHYTLAVENVTTNPRCLFTPYGLSAGEDISGLQAEYVADAFLRSANLFSGTHSYQINAVSRPAEGGSMSYGIRVYQHWAENLIWLPMEPYRQAYFEDDARRLAFEKSDAPVSEMYAQLFSREDSAPFYSGLDIKLPGWAKKPLSAKRLALVELTERYNDFVLEKYLQLPDGSKEFLDGFRSEHGLEAPDALGEGGYGAFLEQMKQVLAQGYSYTLAPTPVPEDRDFAEFFLSESRAGYCVHFATAAVALCRSAGIPARYAEGYAVPSGYNGAWVDVPDKNAHAWLEVYYSGSGWVPVEVTPVSADAPATYYNAQAPSGSATGNGEGSVGGGKASPSPSPSAEPTRKPSARPSASAGPSPSHDPEEIEQEESGKPLWPLVLMGLGVLLLVPVGLWGNRAAHRHGRKKAFSQEDRSKAALALYAHLLRLHELEATLYYGERKPPAYWEETALKARFGRDMLPLEDLQALAVDAARLESALKEELPTDRRLYWEFVRGLF